MIAYHGKQEVKDKYVNRMQAHMDADELIRGVGFENGRGCAVGCTLDRYDHSGFEDELGSPMWLAYLLDELHENTSDNVWPTLAIDVLRAVPLGADLSPVRNQINLFMLARNKDRVKALSNETEGVKAEIVAAIEQVEKLHIDELQGVIISSAAESAAWSAAWSAVEAAEAAAEAAARSAAWSAWSAEALEWSAAMAARDTAWSAESVAWSARAAEYDAIAAELIRLLKALDNE